MTARYSEANDLKTSYHLCCLNLHILIPPNDTNEVSQIVANKSAVQDQIGFYEGKKWESPEKNSQTKDEMGK